MSIRRVCRRLPLRLQELETRTVPASVFWTGGGSSGNWHDALNWSSSPSLPANGDDVTIATATTVTFTGSTPTVSLNSLVCNAPFAISGSTLSIGAGGGSFNGGWSQSSGTLSGTGTITLNSAGLWTGGTWSGAGTTVIAAGISLKIDSSTLAPSINNRIVQNFGSITWVATGGSPQNMNTGDGSWTNFSGSVLDVQANTSWVNVFGSTATPVTTNAGASVTRTVGTGTVRFDGPFNNDSTVTVSTGTLQLNGGGTSTGTFSLAGSLLLSANTMTLNSGAKVTGVGTMTLGSSTLKVNASVNIDSPFSQTAGQLTGVGPLNLNKSATWTGGTQVGPGVTVIPGGATWTLDTTTNALLSNQRTVDISGSVTWLATGVSPQNILTGDAAWTIKTGGQFDLQTNNSWVYGFGSGATPITVEAGGKLLRTAGSATASLQGPVNNNGLIQVSSGTLQFNGGGTSSGTVDVATEVKFNGGTHTWLAGANSTGAGKVTLGTATITASGSATLGSAFEQTAGILTGAGPWHLSGKSTWTGGQQTGPGVTVIPATGVWTVDSSISSLSLNGRTVNLSGAATWIATGVSPQGILTGDGAWNIKTGGTFDVQASTTWAYGFGMGGTPINVEAGGQLLRTLGSATATLLGPLNNNGTVAVNAGTLRANAGGTSSGQFALTAELLYNGGTHTWTTGANSTGAGKLTLGSSTLTTAASVVIGSQFEQTAGQLTGAGTWNLNGNSKWTGGQQLGPGLTVIPAAATWTVDTSTNSLISNNRTYDISGSAVWLASGVSPQNIQTGDGAVNIKAGGSFDVQAGNTWSWSYGANGTLFKIEAGGQLLRTAGSATATINAPVHNDGNINVSTGALNFSAGGTNSATINVATTLNLTGGTHVWNTGTTTSGVGKVALTGGTLNVAGSASVGSQFLQSGGFLSGAGTLTLNNATWTGGQLLGPGTTVIAVGGTWTIDSSTNSLILNDRQVINSGASTWLATGGSPQNILTADGLWTNKFGSSLTLQTNSTWSWWTGTKGTPIVNEPGSTLRRNTGTGTVTVNGSITNNGTIQVDTGTLDIINGNGAVLTNYSATTLTGGNYVIAGTFRFPGANVVTNAASITLDGPAASLRNTVGNTNGLANLATVSAGNSLKLLNGATFSTPAGLSNAGTVTVGAGSALTVPGGLANSGTLAGAGVVNAVVTGLGTISPGDATGAAGLLAVNGNTSLGGLAVDLNGSTAGTGYDQLQVNGDATIGGTLSVNVGYGAKVGDSYRIIDNTGPNPLNGLLSGVAEGGNYVAGPRTYQLSYMGGTGNDAVLTLTAITAPSVGTVVINGGSAQRSTVRSVQVNFDSLVDFAGAPASAFQLKRQSDNATVTLSAVVTNDTVTHVALSFIGGAVDAGIAPLSLSDGRYTLTVFSSQVSALGIPLSGSGGPGTDYVLASASTGMPPTNIFRLFGDGDGNGTVNSADFLAFRIAFLSSSSTFDYDGNGQVDSSDFLQFRLHFLQSV